jgi:hypothetical protein
MIVCYENYLNVFYYVIVENTYNFLLTCKSQRAVILQLSSACTCSFCCSSIFMFNFITRIPVNKYFLCAFLLTITFSTKFSFSLRKNVFWHYLFFNPNIILLCESLLDEVPLTWGSTLPLLFSSLSWPCFYTLPSNNLLNLRTYKSPTVKHGSILLSLAVSYLVVLECKK